MHWKGKAVKIPYNSAGPTTGLTDVKLNLWDPDGTQVVTDGVATEVGSTGKYRYSYTPTKEGDYTGHYNSVTKPRRVNVEFNVVDEPRTGGGRCFYDGPDWTEDEKKAVLELTKLIQLEGMPKELTKALNEISDAQEAMLKKIGEDIEAEMKRLKEDVIEKEMEGMRKEVIGDVNSRISDLKSGNTESVKIIQDEVKKGTESLRREIESGMKALREGQKFDSKMVLEATDARTLAKIIDSGLKKEK